MNFLCRRNGNNVSTIHNMSWHGLICFANTLTLTFTHTEKYTRCQTSNHTKHIFNSLAQITAICFMVVVVATTMASATGMVTALMYDLVFV